MLSYRHAFHAGNDADVVKHVALCALIEAITRKDKPLLYLETHAGAGSYNLRNRFAGHSHEASAGIGMLWGRIFSEAPPAFARYLALVQALNDGGKLRRYPGSPWLAQHLLRSGDRLALAELHPVDQPKLARLMRADARVTVANDDGYGLVRSLLPPIERRGLIFIDPSYETQDELHRLYKALVEGLKRFGTGVYAIWYPVGTKHHADTIVSYIARAARARPSKMLDLRWERATAHARADGTAGLKGCGLAIINPPFGIDETLVREIGFTARLLEPDQREPDVRLTWPVPE
jgi:23S rRNA (adenine2030-N6)-methyltransferase